MVRSGTSPGVYTNEIDNSQIAVAPSTSVGVIVGRARQGPVGQRSLFTSEKSLVQSNGKPDASLDFALHCAVHFFEEGDQLYFTRVAPNCLYGGAVISFNGAYNVSASVPGGIADPTLYSFGSSDLFLITGIDQGVWNDNLFIQVYPNTQANDNTFFVDVYIAGTGTAVESHHVSLDMQLDGYGNQLNIYHWINNNSSYIQCQQNNQNSYMLANPSLRYINTFDAGGSSTAVGIQLTGGNDGTVPTDSDIIEAWDLYSDPETVDVNILINAGYYSTDIQLAMISLCEDRMDCMAILDVPRDNQTLSKAIDWRRNTLASASTYAAAYLPDLLVADEYNSINLYVPPSGKVASRFVYTDTNFDTWFAPAGYVRGAIDANDVYQTYDQGDRDALYDNQLNVIKNFQGDGIKIWGADTLQVKASALSNINVRRLMMYIEKALSNAAVYSVFDPDDPILWAFLKGLCDDFLQPILNKEGLYWYHTTCDETNNTPDKVTSGDVILDVYVQPTLPAKRIHLTAIVNKQGATVTAS